MPLLSNDNFYASQWLKNNISKAKNATFLKMLYNKCRNRAKDLYLFLFRQHMLIMTPKSTKDYLYLKHLTLHIKLIIVTTCTVRSMKCEKQRQILCNMTDTFFNKLNEPNLHIIIEYLLSQHC